MLVSEKGLFTEIKLYADQGSTDEIIAEGASVVRGELPQDDAGPPKVDSEVEVLHEKVTKQIVKEGHGQKPSKYATCFGKSKLRLLLFGYFFPFLPYTIFWFQKKTEILLYFDWLEYLFFPLPPTKFF